MCLLAFDFDGTIAKDGQVPANVVESLRRAAAQSYALFLVTGRLYRQASIDAIVPWLTGIVWENGAVIEHLPSCHIALPFGTIPDAMIHELTQLGIEVIRGKAIAATWAHHEPRLQPITAKYEDRITFEYNKGALMILPRGANKASGLQQLLAYAGLDGEPVIAFGDGENDQTLLEMAHLGIAVQDAVPSLRTRAGRVTRLPGPDGVVEVLHDLLASRDREQNSCTTQNRDRWIEMLHEL